MKAQANDVVKVVVPYSLDPVCWAHLLASATGIGLTVAHPMCVRDVVAEEVHVVETNPVERIL